eukprot:TRINITY_DN9049_c0_g1_i1.p2 TRINITY_DN9049_c0_g1~~TRINITY_DN9049_c0_g1_i1.p2  ORF type:complete len:671 (+),score=255.74 TRINITY_DN9049_c0_g1_i1:87-2099(+)
MAAPHKRPLNVQSAKVKLNELFIQWITLPETQEAVRVLEKNVGGGRPGNGARELDALSAMNEGSKSTDSLGVGPISFNSPPRSPRASPQTMHLQAGEKQRAPLSPMVDELDAAHRQGAMSPHRSPRGKSLAHPAMSEGEGRMPLSPSGLGHPNNSGSPDGGQQRLSAAFAHLDGGQGAPSSPLSAPRHLAHSASDQSLTGHVEDASGGKKRVLTGEPLQNIPQFYFDLGEPPFREDGEKQVMVAKKLFEVRKTWTAKGGTTRGRRAPETAKLERAINVKCFLELTSKTCLLPKWMNDLLFRRVFCYEKGSANYDHERERNLTIHQLNTTITHRKFMDFYEAEMAGKSKERRLFDAIKWDKKRDHITKADLRPLIEEVLLVHPGLEFLKSTPDFQERYADTVQIRMMYSSALRDDSIITWSDFCRSSLYSVLHILDTESDINMSSKTEYFSYEHFYVLYCKFWELDQDHDFFISKDELAKYGNYSLTPGIVDRVFSGKGRPLRSDVPGKMSYEDFVWFCLCEEDKTTNRSLEYWFRCTDIDEDGLLTGYELDCFFKEQKAKMESSYQETVAYEDILCQMFDMISPSSKIGLSLADIKRCRVSGNFFNALFNLNKFIAFEQRDPFVAHAEKQLPEKTEWDRFAKVEYDRMSNEAGEQEDVSEDFGLGGYDGS